MTPDEAIAKWRGIKSQEDLETAFRDKEFRDAYKLAGKLALESGDPACRFWEVDIQGWGKKQFNVNIPPAPPISHDPFGPGANPKLLENMKPIKGAAFPS